MTDDSLNEVRARVERSVFHRWAGMRLDRIAPGDVDVSLEVEPHHVTRGDRPRRGDRHALPTRRPASP